MLDTIFSWNTLFWVLIPIYLLCCIALIVIVLLQKGKGTGFAGAFGVGGGSETIFGPSSARSLPQKLTYIAAGVFMALALVLCTISGKVGRTAAPELEKETSDAPQKTKEVQTLDSLFGPSPEPAPVAAPAAEKPAEAPAPAPAAEKPAEAPAPAPAAEKPAEAPAPAPAAEKPAEAPAPAPAAEKPAEAPAPAPAAEKPAEAPAPAPATPAQ